MTPHHLVIGGRGMIGGAIAAELWGRSAPHDITLRDMGPDAPDNAYVLDLAHPDTSTLPDADIVYLVAGLASFVACESRPDAWAINVDGVLRIAKSYSAAFLVYISSDAVDLCGATALGRQKAYVEMFMHCRGNAAIVRPSRVTEATVPTFARMIVEIGIARKAGAFRWRPTEG